MRKTLATALAATVATAGLAASTATMTAATAATTGKVTAMSNTYEADVWKQINAFRKSKGLPALAHATGCVDTVAAEPRAKKMATNMEMVHYPGLGDAVFKNCGGRKVGENIARGIGFEDPKILVQAWANSSTHHAIMTDRAYDRVAVGAYRDKNGTPYIATVYYAPKS